MKHQRVKVRVPVVNEWSNLIGQWSPTYKRPYSVKLTATEKVTDSEWWHQFRLSGEQTQPQTAGHKMRASSPDSVTNATAARVVGRPAAAESTQEGSQPLQPTLRRNPHRRSTGQLATGQAIRKTFPISALSLLVNIKKDRVHWHGDHVHLVIDTVTAAKLTLTNMKKGLVIHERMLEKGLNQIVALAISKPGLYSVQITADDLNAEASMVKVQRTELELHKGNNVLVPRVIGQYVHVDGGVQYSLLEIYGRPSSSTDSIGVAADEEPELAVGEDGKECVVCLSSDRDTIVLPCRHLCLCADCAESLRSRVDKCPICRECCQGLLQVKLIEDQKSTL